MYPNSYTYDYQHNAASLAGRFDAIGGYRAGVEQENARKLLPTCAGKHLCAGDLVDTGMLRDGICIVTRVTHTVYLRPYRNGTAWGVERFRSLNDFYYVAEWNEDVS